jgi:hypothetical protein
MSDLTHSACVTFTGLMTITDIIAIKNSVEIDAQIQEFYIHIRHTDKSLWGSSGA